MPNKQRRDPVQVAEVASRIDAAVENACARLGVSLNELARMAGIATGGQLGRYRTGERLPDVETITKIADVTGVTTDYLLRGLGELPGEIDPARERPALQRAIDIVSADPSVYHPETAAYLRHVARKWPGDRHWSEWMQEAEAFNTSKRNGSG